MRAGFRYVSNGLCDKSLLLSKYFTPSPTSKTVLGWTAAIPSRNYEIPLRFPNHVLNPQISPMKFRSVFWIYQSLKSQPNLCPKFPEFWKLLGLVVTLKMKVKILSLKSINNQLRQILTKTDSPLSSFAPFPSSGCRRGRRAPAR